MMVYNCSNQGSSKLFKSKVHLKIMTLTPNGNIVCSYSLDDTPNFVRKSDDFYT